MQSLPASDRKHIKGVELASANALPADLDLNMLSTESAKAVASRLDQVAQADMLLEKYIHQGKNLDRRPLSKRKLSIFQEYKDYIQGIDRNYLRTKHGPPIPFIHEAYKVMGVLQLFNPFKFYRYVNDQNGVKEFTRLVNANERAFERGVRIPRQLLKQGRLQEAIESFHCALNAAPARANEVYDTLGCFCMEIDRYQHEQAAGYDCMRYELEDQLEFRAAHSNLGTNYVKPEDPENTALKFAFSKSNVTNRRLHCSQPINWTKLTTALKDSEIPFRAIALAAFIKHKELIQQSVDDEFSGVHAVQYNDARIDLLSGNPTAAIRKLHALAEYEKNTWGNFVENNPLLAQAYSENDQPLEAVQAYSKILTNGLSHGALYEYHYVSFLKYCNLAAKGDPANTAHLALPYLEVLQKKEHHKSDLRNFLLRFYIGKMYSLSGNEIAARESLEKARAGLETELARRARFSSTNDRHPLTLKELLSRVKYELTSYN